MKSFIRENTWLTRDIHITFGWGNGYVLIPKCNKFNGVHYDELNELINIHGGLTFSEAVTEDFIKNWGLSENDLGSWCVGFDTCHYSDTLSKWDKDSVQRETDILLSQLISLSNTTY